MYFHENQITYPFSSKDTDIQFDRDKHYSFINYSSALTADHIYFNSYFHMNSFFSGLTDYLNTLPDYQEIQNIQFIKQKSSVLHLGLDLKKFDNHKTNYEGATPIILWNHRWEYDKNPEDFFNIMNNLSQKKIHFNLVILGQQFRRELTCFKNARKNLKKHILEFGFSNSFTNYAKWLWKADILPITSNQDFFGTSIMEAVFCKTIPILPNRLAYPDLFNLDKNPDLFYSDNKDLLNKLESIIENIEKIRMKNYRELATKYDWSNMINIYDKEFSKYLL